MNISDVADIFQLQFDRQRCAQLFQQYAEPDSPDTITPDGTKQFFEDLGLSIEDVSFFFGFVKGNDR